MKWKLPAGRFILCKKDKRFDGDLAFVSFELFAGNKSKFKLVKLDKASTFTKTSANLLQLQNRHPKKITRLMKKRMLIIRTI